MSDETGNCPEPDNAVKRDRLTDEEREAIRRLSPSGDPLASRTVTLTPEERRVFHGLLGRLGGEQVMIDTDTCRDSELLAAELRRFHVVIDASEHTFTDAEREALEKLRKWAYEIARDNAFTDEVCDAAGAANKALTSFLERHK